MAQIVRAVHKWRSNAELIYDAYRLQYVQGKVFDATPGTDSLWTRDLISENGEYPWGIDAVVDNLWHDDFRQLPHEDETWDTVLFDPPYKLNGTPRLNEMDKRYGVDLPSDEAGRMSVISMGFRECARILKRRGHLLVKCQDQVSSGRVVWQTDFLSALARSLGLRKVDRFDMIGHALAQPMKGRQQRHAHGRASTLLVFRKEPPRKGYHDGG